MNLVELKKNDQVVETIVDFAKRGPEFAAVMLIGLTPEGAPFMMTSNCNGLEKAYMVQFANSFMSNEHFGPVEEIET